MYHKGNEDDDAGGNIGFGRDVKIMTITHEAIQHEIERRRQALETYMTPLALVPMDSKNYNNNTDNATTIIMGAEDVEEFMNDFTQNFKIRAEEFETIHLQQYPTVAKYYQLLVPQQLSKEAFLQRYFYKCCNVDRIQYELQLQPQLRSSASPSASASTTTTTPEKIITHSHSQQQPLLRQEEKNTMDPTTPTRSASMVRFKGLSPQQTANNNNNNTDCNQTNTIKRRAAWKEFEELEDAAAAIPPSLVQRQVTQEILVLPSNSNSTSNSNNTMEYPFRLKPVLKKQHFHNNPHNGVQRAAWKDDEKNVDAAAIPPSLVKRQVTQEMVITNL